jgi:hypothetical protein
MQLNNSNFRGFSPEERFKQMICIGPFITNIEALRFYSAYLGHPNY